MSLVERWMRRISMEAGESLVKEGRKKKKERKKKEGREGGRKKRKKENIIQ